jgi:hypothetical protein
LPRNLHEVWQRDIAANFAASQHLTHFGGGRMRPMCVESDSCGTDSVTLAGHRHAVRAAHSPPVSERGKSRLERRRSPCIRGSRVRAPDPAKVLLSPGTCVWGLPASVAKSVTVRHVRGSISGFIGVYRGFVRFPLWHSLEISDCWGPLCSRVVDARVWVLQISDVTFLHARRYGEHEAHR